MPVLSNIQWLNTNSQRSYPLDDLTTGVDDSGVAFPENIITDLNIWFPDTCGVTAAISSVTISANLVSVTLVGVSTRPENFSSYSPMIFRPLAAITLERPVSLGRNYKLVPFTDGVAGWISFGSGANDRSPASWRFSNDHQATILPRLAIAYPVLPVIDISKKDSANTLNGVIKLVSGNTTDLVIEGANRIIDGACVRVIVFRLNEQLAGNEVYSKYLGPCDGLPETRTCNSLPIYSINGVAPDCNGNINVVFTNPEAAAVVAVRNYQATTLVDYELGLHNICQTQTTSSLIPVEDNCDPSPCTGYDVVAVP